MITYDRLWETMKEKGMTQYRLITYHKFSRGQLSRLKHNKNVNTNTLNTLCRILECNVEDILQYQYSEEDEKKEKEKAKKKK